MAVKVMEPWMPGHLEIIEADLDLIRRCRDLEERAEEINLIKAEADGEDFHGVCLSKVLFENCSFLNCIFEKGEFTDVIFRACDFSNCDFSDSYFNRCLFLSSKGMGAKFCGSSIQNMAVQDCNFSYANFDSCKLEKITFEDTQMTGSNLTQCKCKSVSWNQVQLSSASFFKTSMRGMNFTTCDITNLALSDDLTELKGATVDLYQAAELAKRLGLIIK